MPLGWFLKTRGDSLVHATHDRTGNPCACIYGLKGVAWTDNRTTLSNSVCA